MLTILAASFCALVPTAHGTRRRITRVAPDRKVTLRLHAPRAETVRLNASGTRCFRAS
jgi:hypothetical protein